AGISNSLDRYPSKSFQLIKRLQELANAFEIRNESLVLGMPVGGVSSSQNCGRMSGCNYVIRPWVLERHASFFGQAKFAPQEGLRGGRAQTNDDFRLDQFHFRLQP